MKILLMFECLLDSHPYCAPAKDTRKNAKAKDKITKAHIAPLKKK